MVGFKKKKHTGVLLFLLVSAGNAAFFLHLHFSAFHNTNSRAPAAVRYLSLKLPPDTLLVEFDRGLGPYPIRTTFAFTPNQTEPGKTTFQIREVSLSSPQNEDLLESDRFALEKMTKTSVLTQEEADYYLSAGMTLDPGCVRYIRVFSGNNKNDKLVSTLKLVAGQHGVDTPWTFDVAHKDLPLKNGQLPWTLQFPQEAKELVDRNQEKFIYEYARGANDADPAIFRMNFSLMTLEAARDVIGKGGKLSEAFVYLHTTVQKNADRFSNLYEVPIIKQIGSKDWIHRIRLDNLIENIKPEQYFPEIETLITKINAKSRSDAYEVLTQLQYLHLGMIELPIENSLGPPVERIFTYDNSELLDHKLMSLSRNYGIGLEQLIDLHLHFVKTAPKFIAYKKRPNNMKGIYIPLHDVSTHLSRKSVDDLLAGVYQYYIKNEDHAENVRFYLHGLKITESFRQSDYNQLGFEMDPENNMTFVRGVTLRKIYSETTPSKGTWVHGSEPVTINRPILFSLVGLPTSSALSCQDVFNIPL